jgi:imidazole glycerol-phosphate synthase subunit HisH
VSQVAVIDYKAGNLTSVMKALDALGCPATVTMDPAVVRGAKKVILPGVGHFQATKLLEETGLTEAVRDVIADGVPFLGICVGLQWLFGGSTEAPAVPGLGAFSGQCERFPAGVKVPHVGWNQVDTDPFSRLMRGVASGSFVYYTHSFRAPVVEETVAVTDYGSAFSGAVERGHVMGVQFHPEKSGSVGLQVLRNFLELGC